MNDVINKLSTVVLVLNQIGVNGKLNLLNLGGAIDMIDSTINDLTAAEHTEEVEKETAQEA